MMLKDRGLWAFVGAAGAVVALQFLFGYLAAFSALAGHCTRDNCQITYTLLALIAVVPLGSAGMVFMASRSWRRAASLLICVVCLDVLLLVSCQAAPWLWGEGRHGGPELIVSSGPP